MNIASTIAILLLCTEGHHAYYNFRGRNVRKRMKRRRYKRAPSQESKNLVAPSSSTYPKFGTSLFSKLSRDLPPSSNILFSPVSVYQALSLVMDGATAGSDTELELKPILGPQSAHDNANSLSLRSKNNGAGDDVQFSMATSIWANKLKSSYIARAERIHGADAFSLPTSFAPVDDWIYNKTDGMVEEMMGEGPVDSSITALLVNAVHFKGTWSYEFNPDMTVDGFFSTKKRGRMATANARYMTAHRTMDVIPRSDTLGGAKVLVLDYGKQNKRSHGERPEFSAIFILPASLGDDSMNSAVSGLNSRPISELLKEVRPFDVKLRFPRFKLEFGPSSIKRSLQNMGMNAAFERCGKPAKRIFRSERKCYKFDRMSDDPWLYVDDVLHGASMEVTEEGTEAAAATVVVMRTRSARPRTLEMTFDRPFLGVIWHWRTEMPIFIARVQNPVLSF